MRHFLPPPRDLEFRSDEVLRALEGQSRKRTDVVSGDGLIGSDRIGQFAFKKSDFYLPMWYVSIKEAGRRIVTGSLRS